jgi:arylsulfatase A-like enzyme
MMTDRRILWRGLFIVAIISGHHGRVVMSAETRLEPSRTLNVLFISIDDLNDWVGPLNGHPQVKTPHLDRLAQRGTTFLNAHCQSPLCNPSRTSLLTGLRPSTTGVYALAPWFRTGSKLKNVETLPQWFSKHGYITMTCGKVYHDGYPPVGSRAPGEFDAWGPQGRLRERRPKPFVQTPGGHPLVDWGPYPDRDEDTFDWDIAEWAVEQIQNPSRRPWFLCVGFRHPHVPCYVPQKWFDLYPEDSLVLPPVKDGDRADTPAFSWYLHWKLPEPRLSWLKAQRQWQPLVRAYLASVSFVDAMVGRLLDALNRTGQADRTIVVVWSDHGWHLGEKGITGKNSLWERSTRVPLLFAGPGIARNARCSRPVELLDLYPTLVELCSLPAVSGLEGQSLVPQLCDAAAKRDRPAITTHNPNNHAVRSEHWRYIRYADGSEELYDLRTDPNEWTNLAADGRYDAIKRDHVRWLPIHNADHLPGSRHRDLVYCNGLAIWEGKPIQPGERDE